MDHSLSLSFCCSLFGGLACYYGYSHYGVGCRGGIPRRGLIVCVVLSLLRGPFRCSDT